MIAKVFIIVSLLRYETYNIEVEIGGVFFNKNDALNKAKDLNKVYKSYYLESYSIDIKESSIELIGVMV